MKKNLLLLGCMLCLMSILTGCKTSAGGSASTNPTNQIISLEIISALENESDVYHINYPRHYYTFDREHMEVDSNDMLYCINNKTMTEEDFTYIRDYVLGIPDDIGNGGDNISFKVYFRYYDENGEEQKIYTSGRDILPEGWKEFIEYINYVCGEDYLTGEGDVVEVTPEYLTEVFGVTDDDVKEGTLEDVIEHNNITIVDLTKTSFHMSTEIYRYYADLKEPFIAPYRPTDFVSVDSTEAEYEAFIANYLSKLGEGWEERDSDQKGLRLFCSDDGEYFYIGRSADINEFDIRESSGTDAYCEIYLDAHMEEMSIRTEYIYSPDMKFILVDCHDTDMMLAFVGADETEEESSEIFDMEDEENSEE